MLLQKNIRQPLIESFIIKFIIYTQLNYVLNIIIDINKFNDATNENSKNILKSEINKELIRVSDIMST